MFSRNALLATIAPIAAAGILAPAAQAVAPAPTTFQSVTAEQAYTVPAGITTVRVTATGAPGGTGAPGPTGPGVAGGLGAEVTGDVAVTPGEVLYVEVGGQGTDGSSSGGGLSRLERRRLGWPLVRRGRLVRRWRRRRVRRAALLEQRGQLCRRGVDPGLAAVGGRGRRGRRRRTAERRRRRRRQRLCQPRPASPARPRAAAEAAAPRRPRVEPAVPAAAAQSRRLPG